jgi:hypothetical protein
MRSLAALGLVSGLLLAACGGDDEEEATIPQIDTGPGAPQAAPAPAQTAPATPAPAKTAPPAGGQKATCVRDPKYRNLTFQGIDCNAAYALAQAWDQSGESCNTIDDPSSPEGFNRTCEVQGYTCTTKRDVQSDARFVTCSGAGTVRFTWLPG